MIITDGWQASHFADMPDIDVEWAPCTAPTEGAVGRTMVAGGMKDVRRISTKRGRSQELGRFQTGSLDVLLDNRDRKYDNDHASGIFSGRVVPGRRVWATARWAGVVYWLMDGYAHGWPQKYAPPREAAVELSAGDKFKVLAGTPIPDGSPWDLEVIKDRPVVWHKLGDYSASGTMADSSGNGYSGTYTSGGTSATGLIAQSSDAAVTFNGTTDYARCASAYSFGTDLFPSISSPSATVEFWVKTSQAAPAAGSPVFYLRSGPSNAIYCYLDTAGKLSAVSKRSDAVINDGSTHHVCLTYTSGTEALYVDGVAQSGATLAGAVVNEEGIFLAGAPAIATGTFFNGTIDEVAIYNFPLSATRILAHYNAGKAGTSGAWGGDDTGARIGRVLDAIGLPNVERDVDTGASTCGPGSLPGGYALDYIQTVGETEEGQTYAGRDGPLTGPFQIVHRSRHTVITASRSNTSQATFGISGSDLKYHQLILDNGDATIFNDATFTREGGTPQRVVDVDSQHAYGTQPTSRTGLWADDNQPLDLAHYVVARHKDPQTRVIGIVVKPRRSPATLWPVVLGAEIGDRWTIKYQQPIGVGAVVSKDFLIEGIEHDVTANGEWTATFLLSVAETTQFWVLDDTTLSVLDSTTRVAA